MVRFWYLLVKSGNKTIDEVPERWREAVEQKLAE